MEKLLIVEDNEEIRRQLKWWLGQEYNLLLAADAGQALSLFEKHRPKVVTLDLGLPPHDTVAEGFRCLEEIFRNFPATKVIVITGNDERENALSALQMGAYDYYQKPVEMSELRIILKRAFYLYRIEQENRKLQDVISAGDGFEGMIGICSKMQKVFATITKVAASEATILLIGDSGTGKELVARAIHQRSLRRNRPFVPINCGGIPNALIESELFGYEKGAFTDAKEQKIGMIENADEGTLFLDEIGELPALLQVKLLRFLQDKKIQRLGGREEIKIDTRIIAATNIDLQKAMKDGKFREDLYYRIGVISINLPPLNERGDDILLLADSFLSRFNYANKKNIKGFSPEAIKALVSYDWPGNVRELENKIQRAVIMTENEFLMPGDLFSGISETRIFQDNRPSLTLKDIRQRVEFETIQRALMKNAGNISKSAQDLGLSRPTLHDLINKYNIKVKRYKFN